MEPVIQVPDPVAQVLDVLRAHRDALTERLKVLEAEYETARKRRTPVQQQRDKLNDAIRSLEDAEEWRANSSRWDEIPF